MSLCSSPRDAPSVVTVDSCREVRSPPRLRSSLSQVPTLLAPAPSPTRMHLRRPGRQALCFQQATVPRPNFWVPGPDILLCLIKDVPLFLCLWCRFYTSCTTGPRNFLFLSPWGSSRKIPMTYNCLFHPFVFTLRDVYQRAATIYSLCLKFNELSFK